MDEPEGARDARETLAKLEERLQRDVRDMLEVLRADVPAFFKRTVKASFEEADAADALDDAKVRRLKKETDERADAAARELAARLEPLDAWLRWDKSEPPPRDGKTLDPHPVVGPALAKVSDALLALLEGFGLPRNREKATYRLPSYFVAGHYMKSLVESFWQSLSLHHELREKAHSDEKQATRAKRRARWDQA
jgi:hypothetical protein